MERLTEADIIEINSKVADSWNEGIYKQPFGVDKYTDYVIYQRHETGGYSGGGCWDGMVATPYTNNEPRPNWTALDAVLRKICPDISYLRYKEIESLVKDTQTGDYMDYYGNGQDYDIYFLPLEDLYKYLEI